MKKKLVMLSLAIVLSLSGCGNDYFELEADLQTKVEQEEVAIDAEAESENEAEAESETEEVIEQAENKEPDNHDGSTFTDWKIIQPYDDTYIKYRIPDDYAWYEKKYNHYINSVDEMDQCGAIWARDIDIPDEDLVTMISNDSDNYEVRFAKMNTCRAIRICVYDPECKYVQTVKETVEMLNQYPTSKAEDLGTVQSESTIWELMNVTFYSTVNSEEIDFRYFEAVDKDNPYKRVAFVIGSECGCEHPEIDLSKIDYEYWTEDEVREFLETCVY